MTLVSALTDVPSDKRYPIFFIVNNKFEEQSLVTPPGQGEKRNPAKLRFWLKVCLYHWLQFQNWIKVP